MSIIQSIRDKAAPVTIGVIAISLIGFILMDAGRSGLGGGVSPTDAVGSINGVDVSYEAFQAKMKLNEQMYQMNGRNIDDMTRQQIYSDTWRSVVEEELLEQEYRKLGIDVTDKEYNDMLFGKNPPEWLKGQFVNERGEFDAVAAKQALNEVKKGKTGVDKDLINDVYLEPMVQGAKRNKYFSLLQNSAFVPKWMAEKTIADNNMVASFSFVTAPYSSVADSTVKVTDEQILEYARKHADEFKTEENSRSIAYVSFGFEPSAKDTADVLNALNGLKADFAAAADPGAFVSRNGSGQPFYDGYFSKSRIQIPAKDSIIGAGIGGVYGPYLDVQSYVLSRVVDVKEMPDSVKAKHILIGTYDPRTQQPKLDEATAKKRIDSIEALIKGGANFDSLAVKLSDDEGSAVKGGDLGFFGQGSMVKEFNDFCFEKRTGEMGVVKTQFGYHLIKITGQKNFGPAYKIAYLSRAIEASQATINEALLKANSFASTAKDVKSFDAAVEKGKYTKLVAEEIRENEYTVGALGVNRPLVKDIFEASVGEVLPEPVEMANQFVVVVVTGEEKAGLPSAKKLRPMVEAIVRNEIKGKALVEKVSGATTLEAAAQKWGVQVQRADSISFLSPSLPVAGYELLAGGYGFYKAGLNKVSKPFAGNTGAFLVRPEAIGAKADAAANVAEMANTLLSQQKNTLLYSSMDALRKAANVVDKRSKFL